MSDDPVRSFVARSLRAEVSDVRSEIIVRNSALELERLSFREDDTDRTLILKRVPPSQSVEVQLLPLLARKTDRVPKIYSRGIPPPAVPAWPWVLIEDLVTAPSACHGDLEAIVRAKVAIERAVSADAPALHALGVPSLDPPALVERASENAQIDRPQDERARAAVQGLAGLPNVLCHGDLTCANTRSTERGAVLVEWRAAHQGCGLLDIARLEADVAVFTGKDQGSRLFDLYGELAGIAMNPGLIRAARMVYAAVSQPARRAPSSGDG